MVAALALCAGCSRAAGGLSVGECWIPGGEIDAAVAELQHAFPQFGIDTLRWHLLDGDLGPAALLHHAYPTESRHRREAAAAAAGRLHGGADFETLLREQRRLEPGESPWDPPSGPAPSDLGGRVSAATAVLEPGQWAGPLKTLRGWELIYLVKRYDEFRSRSGVVLMRMVFALDPPGGTAAAAARAREEWNTLPLSGSPSYLDALPYEFRRNRVRDLPTSP